MGLGFRERREVRLVDGDARLTLVASLALGRVTWCDDCRAGACGHGSAQLTAAWDTWTPQLGLMHLDDAGAEAERLAHADDPARQHAERTGTRYQPAPPQPRPRSEQAIREGRERARALLAGTKRRKRLARRNGAPNPPGTRARRALVRAAQDAETRAAMAASFRYSAAPKRKRDRTAELAAIEAFLATKGTR